MINLLLYLIYGLLALAVALTVWSVLRTLLRNRGEAVTWGIPVRAIAWGTVGMLVIVLAVSYLLGSTQSLTINGRVFADSFWLRIADMFIFTSLTLMAVAVVCALIGVSGLNRRRKDHV